MVHKSSIAIWPSIIARQSITLNYVKHLCDGTTTLLWVISVCEYYKKSLDTVTIHAPYFNNMSHLQILNENE